MDIFAGSSSDAGQKTLTRCQKHSISNFAEIFVSNLCGMVEVMIKRLLLMHVVVVFKDDEAKGRSDIGRYSFLKPVSLQQGHDLFQFNKSINETRSGGGRRPFESNSYLYAQIH